VSKSFFQCF